MRTKAVHRLRLLQPTREQLVARACRIAAQLGFARDEPEVPSPEGESHFCIMLIARQDGASRLSPFCVRDGRKIKLKPSLTQWFALWHWPRAHPGHTTAFCGSRPKAMFRWFSTTSGGAKGRVGYEGTYFRVATRPASLLMGNGNPAAARRPEERNQGATGRAPSSTKGPIVD